MFHTYTPTAASLPPPKKKKAKNKSTERERNCVVKRYPLPLVVHAYIRLEIHDLGDAAVVSRGKNAGPSVGRWKPFVIAFFLARRIILSEAAGVRRGEGVGEGVGMVGVGVVGGGLGVAGWGGVTLITISLS